MTTDEPRAQSRNTPEKTASIIYEQGWLDGLMAMHDNISGRYTLADVGGLAWNQFRRLLRRDAAAGPPSNPYDSGVLVEGALTDEQVEGAARALYEFRISHFDPQWAVVDAGIKSVYRADARAALAAAVGVAPPAPSTDRDAWPEHWTKDDKLSDLHARHHSETGNMLDKGECGSPRCEFWSVASDVFDALAAPTPVHIADEAVQTLRALGLGDTAIRERLAQATMLAAASVSDEFVQVVVRIAAKASITSEDLYLMERRGIEVKLDRAMQIAQAIARAHTFTTATALSIAEVAVKLAAPVDESKLAELAEQEFSAWWNAPSGEDESFGQRFARAVREHLDSQLGEH